MLASYALVLKRIASFASRLPWAGVVLLIAIMAAGSLVAMDTVKSLSPGGFEVLDSEVTRDQERLNQAFNRPQVDLLLLASDTEGAALHTDGETDERVALLLANLRANPSIEQIIGPDELPHAWGSEGHDGLILVAVGGTDVQEQASYAEIESLLHSAEADGLDIAIGGRLAANVNAQRMARKDLLRAELIALPLALLFLIAFFRRLVPAILPLLIGGFAVTATLLGLRLLSEMTTLSLFALNIVVFLGLGLAIDYSLFMVERFREELAVGNTVPLAIERTLSTAGKTVLYSGVAVMVSLLALAWIPVVMLQSMAIAGAMVVVLTNLGALVLLPCLLVLLGQRLAPPAQAKPDAAPAAPRGWTRAATAVLRRPGLVCIGVTALLLWVGSPLLRMQTATTDARVFPPDSELYQVGAALSDTSRFPNDPSNAHQIMLDAPQGESFVTPEGLQNLDAYAKQVAAIDGVLEVRGLHGALEDAPAELIAEALSHPAELPAEAREGLDAVLEGSTTVVTVISDLPASSPEARAQLQAILAAAPIQYEAHAAGRTARASELQAALAGRLPLAAASVALASFMILLLAFGAPVVALKAVIVNAMSLCASFGALVWVFQDGRFEGLLSYQSIGTVDPTVPVMMFALVFGLSMDYELFLLSRIREAYERNPDNHASVVEGLSKTGPIITTAALILIAVVASLTTGTLTFIKQLGLGMALAIVVDASLIRIALVPTTMVLLGRANWWSPKWLTRARGWLGVDLREGEAELVDGGDKAEQAGS